MSRLRAQFLTDRDAFVVEPSTFEGDHVVFRTRFMRTKKRTNLEKAGLSCTGKRGELVSRRNQSMSRKLITPSFVTTGQSRDRLAHGGAIFSIRIDAWSATI